MTGNPGPDRPIAADWLALRRAPDEEARGAAAGLLADLAEHLAERARDATGTPETIDWAGPVAVVDVGAGTGANRAYLAPRLPFPTAWTLLDHDPALLGDDGNDGCRRVLGGIAELPALLAEVPPWRGLVTCSALLDLLSAADLDALVGAVTAAGVPALFALTVTGAVTIEPADAGDETVRAAFDAHQARAGRPGPGAARYVAQAARRAGAQVRQARTPWRLTADASAARPFLRRYLTDRAAAAAEVLDDLSVDVARVDRARVDVARLDAAPVDDAAAARVGAWLDRRLSAVEEGTLRLTVEHVDLLLLP